MYSHEQELLATLLEEMYTQAIPQMNSKQPEEIAGSAEKIFSFGLESFQAGFLCGMKAGLGVKEETEHD